MKKNVYIIAEIGINHNGSFDLAKELIDKAFVSGANAVKFQKRTIEEVYTKEELEKPRESQWGKTNRDQKEGLEFSIEEYVELENYTKEKGLDFIVSCWDIKSVDLVEKYLNVDYHKIASALLTDTEFLKRLKKTNKPIIASIGMTEKIDVVKAINFLYDDLEYVLSCTSTYPTKPEEVNLSTIISLKKMFPDLKIGFSNHYSGLDACVGAVALGAECVEFHITKDRTMYGSDQPASIENSHGLIKGIRNMEKMVGDGIIQVYDSEKSIAEKLRKVNKLSFD